jgi:hypothetical protein
MAVWTVIAPTPYWLEETGARICSLTVSSLGAFNARSTWMAAEPTVPCTLTFFPCSTLENPVTGLPNEVSHPIPHGHPASARNPAAHMCR